MNTDAILDFLIEYYIWFIIGGAILFLAIVGFIADKKKLLPKNKKNIAKEQISNDEKNNNDTTNELEKLDVKTEEDNLFAATGYGMNEKFNSVVSDSAEVFDTVEILDDFSNDNKENFDDNGIADNINYDKENVDLATYNQSHVNLVDNGLNDEIKIDEGLVDAPKEESFLNSTFEYNQNQSQDLFVENQLPVADFSNYGKENFDDNGIADNINYDKENVDLATYNQSHVNLVDNGLNDEIKIDEELVDAPKEESFLNSTFEYNQNQSQDLFVENQLPITDFSDKTEKIEQDTALTNNFDDNYGLENKIDVRTNLEKINENINNYKFENQNSSLKRVDETIDKINNMNFSIDEEKDKLEDTMQISYSQLKEMVEDIIEENEREKNKETDNVNVDLNISNLQNIVETKTETNQDITNMALPKLDSNAIESIKNQDDEDDVWKF